MKNIGEKEISEEKQMNQTNVNTVIIDSIEVTEPYLRMYITKKLLEGGLDASRAGFRYIKEILFMNKTK